MLTYEELKNRFVGYLEREDFPCNVVGSGLVARFMRNEKVCIKTMADIITDLDGHRLKNGMLVQSRRGDNTVYLGNTFCNELLAHKLFHTGGINCPRKP